MDWFAVSAKFYMDLDDKGVSEKAQTFLIRACAYMALNETGGFLPFSAVSKLGLRAAKHRIGELEQAGIMVRSVTETVHEPSTKCDTIREQSETPTGYVFPAWERWNAPLEAQVKKKKADRERVAEKRNVARQSHSTRAGTQNSNSTEPTYVGSSAHVSNASAGAQQPRGPAVPVDGWRLVRAAIPDEHPQATRTALALEAGALLTAGTPAVTVDSALRLWLTKPNLGPRTLPSLVSEVLKARAAPAAKPGGYRGAEAVEAGAEAARILAEAQNHTSARELE